MWLQLAEMEHWVNPEAVWQLKFCCSLAHQLDNTKRACPPGCKLTGSCSVGKVISLQPSKVPNLENKGPAVLIHLFFHTLGRQFQMPLYLLLDVGTQCNQIWYTLHFIILQTWHCLIQWNRRFHPKQHLVSRITSCRMYSIIYTKASLLQHIVPIILHRTNGTT